MSLNTNDYKTLIVKYVGTKKFKDTLSYGELCKYRESWILNCPRCGVCLRLKTEKSILNKRHRVLSVSPVHIEPSIICLSCKAHFYVRKGKVVII